jgi:hypothetical protein
VWWEPEVAGDLFTPKDANLSQGCQPFNVASLGAWGAFLGARSGYGLLRPTDTLHRSCAPRLYDNGTTMWKV